MIQKCIIYNKIVGLTYPSPCPVISFFVQSHKIEWSNCVNMGGGDNSLEQQSHFVLRRLLIQQVLSIIRAKIVISKEADDGPYQRQLTQPHHQHLLMSRDSRE
jgi:hypothetical protein